MKKQLLSMVAVSFIIGIAIITVISCSKTENDNSLQTEKDYQLKEFIPAYEDIIPLINQFNSKYKEYKLGYKSGEEVPLNEAIWNLEAGVNYEYCEPKENLNGPNSTTYSINIGLSEGTNGEYLVSEDDLMTAFDEIKTYTENELTTNSSTFIVADVELKEINGLGADLDMVVTSGHPHLPSCDIEDDDYWYFADGLGKCYPYTGGSGNDASTRIDYILNCTAYACPGTVFFTNITTYYGVGTGSSDYANTCCDPDYMDWIRDEAWDVIDNNQPSGKIYIDCDYSCDLIPGGGSLWGHIFDELRYGVYNCKPLETK